MKKFIKEINDNKIIFTNTCNKTKLTVIHDDNPDVFDSIFIDRKYDLEFIDFVIKVLKSTNDILSIFSLYDSVDLENLFFKHGLKVSNYQYTIKYKKYLDVLDYNISDKLDNSAKEYYLKMINDVSKINHEYYSPGKKYINFDKKWFNNDEFKYKIYENNNKIVGIIEYKIIHNNASNDIFDYNNKICIRSVFAENIIILENILKNFISIYKKDIVINVTYTDKELINVIKKLNGIFNYCLYILVDKII